MNSFEDYFKAAFEQQTQQTYNVTPFGQNAELRRVGNLLKDASERGWRLRLERASHVMSFVQGDGVRPVLRTDAGELITGVVCFDRQAAVRHAADIVEERLYRKNPMETRAGGPP